MSKWGPVTSHSRRAASEVATHRPLRVPIISTVPSMTRLTR